MRLSRNKILKLLNGKNQSRKKMRIIKKENRKKCSFRKKRPLNLRNKTLKNCNNTNSSPHISNKIYIGGDLGKLMSLGKIYMKMETPDASSRNKFVKMLNSVTMGTAVTKKQQIKKKSVQSAILERAAEAGTADTSREAGEGVDSTKMESSLSKGKNEINSLIKPILQDLNSTDAKGSLVWISKGLPGPNNRCIASSCKQTKQQYDKFIKEVNSIINTPVFENTDIKTQVSKLENLINNVMISPKKSASRTSSLTNLKKLLNEIANQTGVGRIIGGYNINSIVSTKDQVGGYMGVSENGCLYLPAYCSVVSEPIKDCYTISQNYINRVKNNILPNEIDLRERQPREMLQYNDWQLFNNFKNEYDFYMKNYMNISDQLSSLKLNSDDKNGKMFNYAVQLKDLGTYLYSTEKVESFKKERFDAIIKGMKKDTKQYNYNIFIKLLFVIKNDIILKKMLTNFTDIRDSLEKLATIDVKIGDDESSDKVIELNREIEKYTKLFYSKLDNDREYKYPTFRSSMQYSRLVFKKIYEAVPFEKAQSEKKESVQQESVQQESAQQTVGGGSPRDQGLMSNWPDNLQAIGKFISPYYKLHKIKDKIMQKHRETEIDKDEKYYTGSSVNLIFFTNALLEELINNSVPGTTRGLDELMTINDSKKIGSNMVSRGLDKFAEDSDDTYSRISQNIRINNNLTAIQYITSANFILHAIINNNSKQESGLYWGAIINILVENVKDPKKRLSQLPVYENIIQQINSAKNSTSKWQSLLPTIIMIMKKISTVREYTIYPSPKVETVEKTSEKTTYGSSSVRLYYNALTGNIQESKSELLYGNNMPLILNKDNVQELSTKPKTSGDEKVKTGGGIQFGGQPLKEKQYISLFSKILIDINESILSPVSSGSMGSRREKFEKIISSNIKSILGEGATDEELYSMLIKFLEKLKYEAYLSFRRVNSGVNRKSRKLLSKQELDNARISAQGIKKTRPGASSIDGEILELERQKKQAAMRANSARVAAAADPSNNELRIAAKQAAKEELSYQLAIQDRLKTKANKEGDLESISNMFVIQADNTSPSKSLVIWGPFTKDSYADTGESFLDALYTLQNMPGLQGNSNSKVLVKSPSEIITPGKEPFMSEMGEGKKPTTDDKGADKKPTTDDKGADKKPSSDDKGADKKPTTDDKGADKKSTTDDKGADKKPSSDDKGADKKEKK